MNRLYYVRYDRNDNIDFVTAKNLKEARKTVLAHPKYQEIKRTLLEITPVRSGEYFYYETTEFIEFEITGKGTVFLDLPTRLFNTNNTFAWDEILRELHNRGRAIFTIEETTIEEYLA